MVAAGDPITSADITTIEDYTIRKPICRLVQTVAQSIPDATDTALTFATSSEEIDTHGFHDESVNNTRITPTIAGYYRLSGAYVSSGTATAPTQMSVSFTKNGTSLSSTHRQIYGIGVTGSRGVSTTIVVSANGTTDFFTCLARHTTGSAINTSVAAPLQSVFECTFERPL